MTKPRIASSSESYLLRRAEQAEAENARLRQQVAALVTDHAALRAGVHYVLRARAYNDEVRAFLEDVLARLEVTDNAR